MNDDNSHHMHSNADIALPPAPPAHTGAPFPVTKSPARICSAVERSNERTRDHHHSYSHRCHKRGRPVVVNYSAMSSDASSTALLVHCSATSSMRRPLLCSSTALQRRLMRCPLVRRIGESKREIYCMLAKNAVMLKKTKTYIDSCTMADGRTSQ